MSDADIVEMVMGAVKGYIKRFFDGKDVSYPLELTLMTRLGVKRLIVKFEDEEEETPNERR